MKKAVILVIVLGVMLVISILAVVALNLMSQESRIAEHKIRRLRAFYAAEAGKVDALEQLRRGIVTIPPIGTIRTLNLPTFGQGLPGYPSPNGYNVTTVIVAWNDTVTDPAHPCPATAPSDCCIFSTVTNY
jgi:hypothetical protein